MNKTAFGPALLLLASCGASDEQSSIVLECSGTDFDYVSSKGEAITYLLQVVPNGRGGNSLQFYNQTDKRFVDACNERFECGVVIGPDSITESGHIFGDGTVLLSKNTEINRRTGTMRVTLRGSGEMGGKLTFEGQCKTGVLPEYAPTKF